MKSIGWNNTYLPEAGTFRGVCPAYTQSAQSADVVMGRKILRCFCFRDYHASGTGMPILAKIPAAIADVMAASHFPD